MSSIEKQKQKTLLQKELNLSSFAETPLIAVVSELLEKNGAALLEKITEGLMTLPVQLVLLGVGSERFRNMFLDLANKHPEKVRILPNSTVNRKKLLFAADIVLSPDHQPEPVVEAAFEYGCVPVTPACHIVMDYDPTTEQGNAFVYSERNPWSAFTSLVRALETYRLPYDWNHIVRNGKEDGKRS
jgi:starch synthase